MKGISIDAKHAFGRIRLSPIKIHPGSEKRREKPLSLQEGFRLNKGKEREKKLPIVALIRWFEKRKSGRGSIFSSPVEGEICLFDCKSDHFATPIPPLNKNTKIRNRLWLCHPFVCAPPLNKNTKIRKSLLKNMKIPLFWFRIPQSPKCYWLKLWLANQDLPGK